jgi:hypothetical protein
MNKEDIIEKGTIDSKQEYYFLYEKGFFGNKAITWNSLSEMINSGWKGEICIRGKKGISRSKARFNLSLEEARNYIHSLEKEGILEKDLTFNQSLPDEELLIQGEVMRSLENYSLTYTRVKEPMNYAFAKETLHENGVNALHLLKQNLFPSSYEDLQALFDIFPDSVIEFSSYRIPVGNLPNRNAILWEVRNY